MNYVIQGSAAPRTLSPLGWALSEKAEEYIAGAEQRVRQRSDSQLDSRARVLKLAMDLEDARQLIIAEWKAAQLDNKKLPSEFVIRTITSVKTDVIDTWSRTKVKLKDDYSSLSNIIDQMGVLTTKRVWPEQLKPMLEYAQAAEKRGDKVVNILNATSAKKSLLTSVSLAFVDISDDLRGLFWEIGQRSSLQKAVDSFVGYIMAAVRAVIAAVKAIVNAIKSAAKWLKEHTVDAAIDIAEGVIEATSKAVKYSLVAGALYLVWKMRQGASGGGARRRR